MKKAKELSLQDILRRAINLFPQDVEPLCEYLGWTEDTLPLKKDREKSVELAKKLSAHLCLMGSNDIASWLRGGEPVSYDEVVFDVGKKLKANVIEGASAEENEGLILEKVFADALDKMSLDEKRLLFASMNLNVTENFYAQAGTIVVQLLLREYGGFVIYRMAVIIANMVARAILGAGLSFAANIAITRTIGVILGPIGWIATGLWLAVDIAGPAFRKTVPAVIHTAFLRRLITERVTIGIVGAGASGKDAVMKSVFNIDTGNINPIAGSTDEVEVYNVLDKNDNQSNIQIANYPGFNDYRTTVNKQTDDFLNHTDIFVVITDIARGLSGTDIEIIDKIVNLKCPTLVCLNKYDLPRTDFDRESLHKAARERINSNIPVIPTVFDPDIRFWDKGIIGKKETKDWIISELRAMNKSENTLASLEE